MMNGQMGFFNAAAANQLPMLARPGSLAAAFSTNPAQLEPLEPEVPVPVPAGEPPLGKEPTKRRKTEELLKKPKLFDFEKNMQPVSPFAIYISDVSKVRRVVPKRRTEEDADIGIVAKEYQQLSAGEHEALVRRSQANREENERQMREGINSLTPEEVYLENERRTKWNRQNQGKKQVKLLKDERIPSRPPSAWLIFLANERARAQPTGGIREQSGFVKTTSAKWRSMSEHEKAYYKEQSRKESEAYKAFKTKARDMNF